MRRPRRQSRVPLLLCLASSLAVAVVLAAHVLDLFQGAVTILLAYGSAPLPPAPSSSSSSFDGLGERNTGGRPASSSSYYAHKVLAALATAVPMPRAGPPCKVCERCDLTPLPPGANGNVTLAAGGELRSDGVTCSRCVGCTHTLTPLSKDVSINGAKVKIHTGATRATVYRARDAYGEVTAVKLHGIVSTHVRRDMLNHSWYRISGNYYKRGELQLVEALGRLTAECGLDKVLVREWLAPLRAIQPESGAVLNIPRAVFAEFATGASVNALSGGLPGPKLLDVIRKISHQDVRDAAMFDLLFQQGDRHAENIFVNPDTGELKMIDTRDGVMAEGVDSIYIPGTFLFERNKVGNGALLSSSSAGPKKTRETQTGVRKVVRAMSQEMPLLSLDWRCHVRNGDGDGDGNGDGNGKENDEESGEGEVIESEDGITWTHRRDDVDHPLVGVRVNGATSGSGGMELSPQLRQCLRRLRQLGPGGIYEEYDLFERRMGWVLYNRSGDLLRTGFLGALARTPLLNISGRVPRGGFSLRRPCCDVIIIGRKKYRCVAEGEAIASIPAEINDLDLARAAKRGGVSRARRDAEEAAAAAVAAAAEEERKAEEERVAADAAAAAVEAEEEAKRVAPDAHDWEIAAGVVEADDGSQEEVLNQMREEKMQRERERQERLKILRSWEESE